METTLSTLHQINLLYCTHYTQWLTRSCTHSFLDYYPVKVKNYTTVTSTYSRPLVNINFTDFKTANRNSTEHSRVTLKSCFFHYTQCILRKTHKLGLATAYRDNVRRAAVLPLVPPEPVEDVWFNALEDREEIAINTTAFADYVTKYSVDGNNRQQWNHFDNEGPRTNNHQPNYR